MRRITLLRAMTILGLGVAGLVGGHALGYALAFPDIHHRSATLAQTGHSYIPSASWLAVVLGVSAIVTGIAAGHLQRGRSRSSGLRQVAVRMVALQCAAFVSLEIVERALSGAPMASLSVGLLAIGLVAQVAIALVLALVVAVLRRIGACIGAKFLVSAVRGCRCVLPLSEALLFSRTAVRYRVRGPPAPVVV